MREELLHYIWKYRKYTGQGLKTSNGEDLTILNNGSHNHLQGPDFFNAQVRIGDQLWAGNVEIHINASDWYAHHHEKDKFYDNVVLHVVWNDDVSVYRKDGTEIPTLELKNRIDAQLLETYRELMKANSGKFINCETNIAEIPEFDFKNWLERMFLERLEDKSKVIERLLKDFQNDWEKVLFTLLLKNFGSKINGEAFFQLGKNLDFSKVRHLLGKPQELESLLFGMVGLLEREDVLDTYYKELQNSFKFLSAKYGLGDIPISHVSFFKLRPPNFPTIRLSQFAMLYASSNNLFRELIHSSEKELYGLFKIKANSYWDSHYNFGKESKKSYKAISKNFVDLLIINTIIPLRFCYFRHKGNYNSDTLLSIMQNINEEKNSIIENFKLLGVEVNSAFESQALLQLYRNFCTQNKCLECAVGSRLLNLKS